MMERRTRLRSFKNKIELFDAQKFRFNEHSRLLIAVPALDLKIGEDPKLAIAKEIEEAEVFAKHVKKTIGAQVLVLVELHQIDALLDGKPVDCLIDIHELHSKQRDFIIRKIKQPHEPWYSKLITLYP